MIWVLDIFSAIQVISHPCYNPYNGPVLDSNFNGSVIQMSGIWIPTVLVERCYWIYIVFTKFGQCANTLLLGGVTRGKFYLLVLKIKHIFIFMWGLRWCRLFSFSYTFISTKHILCLSQHKKGLQKNKEIGMLWHIMEGQIFLFCYRHIKRGTDLGTLVVPLEQTFHPLH